MGLGKIGRAVRFLWVKEVEMVVGLVVEKSRGRWGDEIGRAHV